MPTVAKMTKSPVRLVRAALKTAQKSLDPYSSKYSPRLYTQHQLFAVLVLRQFFKTDLRGIIQLLNDFSDLRGELGLKIVPHYSTLCYAEKRLLKKNFTGLQQAIFLEANRLNLIGDRPEAIVDATGLETRHVSRYYVWRKGQKRHARYAWPKLTVVCHRQSHLWPGAYVSMGPSQDSPQFTPAMQQANLLISFDRVLGDKGYDAQHNHRLCRETLGIRSTVIPVRKRRYLRRYTGKYRQQMKKRFFSKIYGQRWQVESSFSRNKRLLGSALKSRTWITQQAECQLRVLTHNLMILRCA